jgi:hypothetical protein
MTRQEEIVKQVAEEQSKSKLFESIDWRAGFIQGAKWADKTMIDKACDILWAMLYEQDDNDVVKVSSWEYDNLEDFMFSFRIKLEE